MPIPIRTVKIWINAFIPRTISGYTRPVPKGIHAGKTMIPGPFPVSDCFLTDQRDFSNDIRAKSRMHSEVKVDFTGSRATIKQWHNCDWTTECDCEDGDVECHKKGSNGRMNLQLLPASTPRLAVISVNCAASNPCAPISRLFGDIDYNGTFTVDQAARSVTFKGKIDKFPAFESYVAANDGRGIAIFKESPPAGNTVGDLPRNANRPIYKRVTIP
jgi:hypothetical protein